LKTSTAPVIANAYTKGPGRHLSFGTRYWPTNNIPTDIPGPVADFKSAPLPKS
jgi:hypothetical protein